MSGWRCSRRGSARPGTRGWTPRRRWRRRLHRGSLTGWAVGFVAFGAITGGIAASAGDLINSSPQLAAIISRLGGAGVLIDTFLGALGAYAGLLAGAYAISAVLRMHTEETAERVSPVLATAVGRTRWLSGHLMFALGGAVLLLALCGLVTGVLHGVRIGDLPAGLDKGMLAMLIQIPPVMIMGALAMVIYGWWPRLSAAAWVALGLALVFGLLGRVLQLPQILLDLSPYTHMPALPGRRDALGPGHCRTRGRRGARVARDGRVPAPGRDVTGTIVRLPDPAGRKRRPRPRADRCGGGNAEG